VGGKLLRPGLVVCSDRTRSNSLKLEHKKFVLMCRRISLWLWWWSTGTGSPERMWSLLLWKYSRPIWTPTCVTWYRVPALAGGLEIDDLLKSLPTPAILWFCDSVPLYSMETDGEICSFPVKRREGSRETLFQLLGSEQPDLAVDVPVHCWKLDQMAFKKVPSNPKILWLWESDFVCP